MKRYVTVALLIVLFIPMISFAQVGLVNASLDNGYRAVGANEVVIAGNWNPWYDESGGRHRPEWKEETAGTGSGRVLSGSAQKQFTTFSLQDAGIYQQVPATPGTWYEFGCYVYVWSSEFDDPNASSGRTGRLMAIVGINPWGDTSAKYRTTVWGKESVNASGQPTYDQWTQVSVTAQAWSNTITVFTRAEAIFAVKHNDSYWDSCWLREVEGSSPQPTPTPRPTYTPYPTATPRPTYTPYPTATPYPTPTPGPGDPVDYERIRQIFYEVITDIIERLTVG